MNNATVLVRRFGFIATLVNGDAMTLDRWQWLSRHLPRTRNGERLLEVGCGSGAFTIGAALRGYDALGLSWSEFDLGRARARAEACGVAARALFETNDARRLGERTDLAGRFDVVICCETIEHILDDRRLMLDLHACLRPGGRLLLTAPNHDYRAITPSDDGPFCETETGWHVRRGYTSVMFRELCAEAGLVPEKLEYCSGWLSQKISWWWRLLERVGPRTAWLCTLPLRVLPPLFDRPLTRLLRWPGYSLCLVAYRPRFTNTGSGN